MHDITIILRASNPLHSNTSTGLPLAQMKPQRLFKYHQSLNSIFTPPILPKATRTTTSTVIIQLDRTSIPIIRPKLSIPRSSKITKLSKLSHASPSQLHSIPQPNNLYFSPHHLTRPSNHTPPPRSMSTLPQSYTTFNPPV